MTDHQEKRTTPPPGLQPFIVSSGRASRSRPRPRVLVAEDNGQMCALIALSLREAGYDVVECHDGFQLVEHLGTYLLPESTETYDLVISDIRMPHLSGLEVLEGLGKKAEFPPVILITAFGDSETHAKARELGAVALFDKPFSLCALIDKVQEILPVRGSSEAPDTHP